LHPAVFGEGYSILRASSRGSVTAIRGLWAW